MPPPAERSEPPQPRQFRVRSLMLAVAASAFAAWLARDPLFRSIAFLILTAVALPVLILVVLMGLAWLGFAAAAVLSRIGGWVRRAATFPDDPPGG